MFSGPASVVLVVAAPGHLHTQPAGLSQAERQASLALSTPGGTLWPDSAPGPRKMRVPLSRVCGGLSPESQLFHSLLQAGGQ